MAFTKEADFEQALVTLLFDKGWEHDVLEYKTEAELIQNWADILYNNNKDVDRLNGAPLTEGEMQQIIEQIKLLRTPLRLNGFINGKTVPVKRDNPADPLHFGKEIHLKIYDRQEIAAGSSRYQIARQPRFATQGLRHDRRGDLMLLINGMPVIHVELKRSGVELSQACNQIEKYAQEGVFTGLFALVQVFVAMTPEETVYFANPGPDGRFDSNYYFHWADFNNELIDDWRRIASTLLYIPMAHELIGYYTVADSTDGILKVMRSYQYYAATTLSDRVAKVKWGEKDTKGGYIEHATGSGKTLTSFKSAMLIASSHDADKVVFLMDRVELGTQSLLDYRGFADDAESVQATENTDVLVSKLKSDDVNETLIVTSIQKMSRIKADVSRNASDIEKINRKRIVLIIDEAHRDVFGEMLQSITSTFPNALLFGFTGTPIYEDNQKKMNTTASVFGNQLHRYSIADGIRDHNVLGFDPYQVFTYKDMDLRKAVALEKAKAVTEAEALADPKKRAMYYHYLDHTQVPMAGYRKDDDTYVNGIEDYIPTAQFECEEHRQKVVEDILEQWTTLSHGGRFHAIFATSNIPEAVAYYQLFKARGGALRVAALFDPSIDNNGKGIVKENAILEMLEDYNARYGRSYKLENYALYKQEIALRLAHKRPYKDIENAPEKQINLLIVVDQMLTGFDSKWINTLYLDKVLVYERLIQAFSRTNRLFGPEKPFGVIRYYRYPHTMKKNIEDAFRLYSGERPYGVFVDKLESNLCKLNELFDSIEALFSTSGVEGFSRLPSTQPEKAMFAKLFKQFNAYLEAAKVQGFTWQKCEQPNALPVSLHCSELQYSILLQRYKELFSGDNGNSGEEIPYAIDTYLTEINTGVIDAAYMNARFTKYLKALQAGEEASEVLDEIYKSFATLSQEDQKYANLFMHDVQRGDVVVDDTRTLREHIAAYRAAAKNDQIHRFSAAIGVDEQLLRAFMDRHVSEVGLNEYGMFDELKSSVDHNTARAYFERAEGKQVMAFRVPAKVDALLRRFILCGGFDVE